MKEKRPTQDWFLLSAYIDGELTAREKENLEQRLKSDVGLREELEKLSAARSLIRTLPRKKTPRSFALTPEMAARRKSMPWAGLFGFTSAITTIAAVILLIFQFAPGLFTQAMPSIARDANSEVALLAEEAVQKDEAPEIIFWNGPPTSLWATGKGGGEDVSQLYTAPPLAYGSDTAISVQPTPAGAVIAPGIEESHGEADEQVVQSEAPQPEMMEAAPAEEESILSAEPMQAPVEGSAPSGESNNPILGIRPTEEMGQMDVTETRTSMVEKPPAPWIASAGLLLLALLSGLAALLFKHKLR